ncbi:hypothetical protein JTB14_008843 [Gonioctena quinquepunctata]|nr:hypothetical protein JTB14_008843 [Gonioctena quinquepunctata]
MQNFEGIVPLIAIFTYGIEDRIILIQSSKQNTAIKCKCRKYFDKVIENRRALAGAVRLEGDVITANGSILSGQLGHHCTETTSLDPDDTSVCSCPCGCLPTNSRHRFTVRRSPTQIRHLLPVLPMHELHLPHGPVVPPPAIYTNHRASI